MTTTNTKLHPSFEILMLQVEIQYRIRRHEQTKEIILKQLYSLRACLPGKSKTELAEIQQENFRLSAAIQIERQQAQAFVDAAERRIKKLSKVAVNS